MSYQINPIAKLEVFVLMDNISDPFTKSHAGMRWNEFQYRFDIRQKTDMCGADMCRACNGLSMLIRIHESDGSTHAFLFDTGPDDGLVVENAERMGLDLTEVEAIVLSHGHFDHYGGTLSVLDAIGKKDLPVYVHPELFLPRAFNKGKMIEVSYNLTVDDVEKHGGRVIEDKNPIKLFNDTLLLSGEVPRETTYEVGHPAECRLNAGKWESSPEIIDERCLVFNLKDKGLCVFTACGHTGVVNATEHAKSLLSMDKVHLVMGGFHLAGPTFADRVKPTVSDLIKINPDYIATGHCTGRVAQTELTNLFSDRHIPYAVGTVFSF